MSGRARRFYGLGALVCVGLLVVTGVRFTALTEGAPAVAAAMFVLAFGAAAGLGSWGLGRPGSRLRQDPARPGSPWYWRIVLAGAIVPIFDFIFEGPSLFAVTGSLLGLLVAVLLDMARRARSSTAP